MSTWQRKFSWSCGQIWQKLHTMEEQSIKYEVRKSNLFGFSPDKLVKWMIFFITLMENNRDDNSIRIRKYIALCSLEKLRSGLRVKFCLVYIDPQSLITNLGAHVKRPPSECMRFRGRWNRSLNKCLWCFFLSFTAVFLHLRNDK